MRINKVGTNNFTFKSVRTDRNTVKQLKLGEKPIIENNKQNIYTALGNLAANPDRANIEFLLDIADNLQYGQGGQDSAFQSALDEDGFSPSLRENTDWSKALKDTISLAFASSSDDVEDLKAKFDEIFSSSKTLSEEQKALLEFRKSLTELIVDGSTVEDAETLTLTANILKNLDYFVASSEIPFIQKRESLEHLIYFMTDEYKITPQLADKKLNILDEMLNDMVIQTPENSVLSIKTVDQRKTGMCAAISICRKAMAYEDKVKYIELLMDELSDSPTMSVYDVTELGTGKKVQIHKTRVDYDAAIAQGYRIIDASAHNWMHNAHASGNGTIQTENYVAFDEHNYGIFNDSSFYLAFDESILKQKTLLAAIIKEREFYESFMKTKKQYSDASRNISTVKKEAIETQSAAVGRLNTLLKEIFPEKSNSEITKALRSTFKFYTGTNENNEVNVAKQLPGEVKQNIIVNYLLSQLGSDISPEQASMLQENAKTILGMVSEYTTADAKVEKLQNFNSPKSKFLYNKKLYQLAAAHRVAMEANVNLDNGIQVFEKTSGVPTRDIQILKHLKELRANSASENIRSQFADENGVVLSQEQFEDALMKDAAKIEVIIPAEIDSVLDILLGYNTATAVSKLLESTLVAIQEGNKNALEYAQKHMNIDGEKYEVINKLKNMIAKLNDNPSQKIVLEAIRTLGYENRIDFASVLVSSVINSLSNGVSDAQYAKLIEKFGSADKIRDGINMQVAKFQELAIEYSDINEKWRVPSARTNILEGLEKQKGIISRKKLDKLQRRFAQIEAGMVANEKIANMKERAQANNKLYKFTPEELDIFEEIERNLATMKKYSKMQYLALNKELFDALEKQYSYIGMLNGQFWVREEGSSGLTANEQTRIIEQMTGKPYYMQGDIYSAAEQIKKGEGSGIISYSVEDFDYGFHAQYIPSVTSEIFVDPKTGHKSVQDIVWTDNSWGNVEKESYWNGRDGHMYTDYGRGFGWKKGFLLDEHQKIGIPVKEIHGATGVAESDNDSEFSLFSDVVLPGIPSDTYPKLYKTFAYIMATGSSMQLYDGIEKALEANYKINTDYLTGIDDVTEALISKLSKRAEKEIKSKEDYEKLPKDDPLRFVFDKVALYFSVENPELSEMIVNVKTPEELEQIQQNIVDGLIEDMGVIMGKTDGVIEKVFTASLFQISDLFEELDKKYGVSFPVEVQEEMLNAFFINEDRIQEVDGSLKDVEKYFCNNVVQVCVDKFGETNEEALGWFINQIQGVILGNIDSLIRVKSLDSPVLTTSPAGKYLIAAVDKYLDPDSDEDLLSIIQTLQNSNYDVSSQLIDVLNQEDLGMKVKSGYDYLIKYNAADNDVYKIFTEMVASVQIQSMMRTSDDQSGLSTTPEEAYRALHVKLADMDVQKFIKGFKHEFFQKYKVRQAFPDPVIIPDAQLEASFAEMLTMIKFSIEDLIQSRWAYEIILKVDEVKDKFASKPIYQQLMKRKDIEITDENRAEIEALTQGMVELCEATGKDKSMPDITQKISDFIIQLTNFDEKINGKKAGSLLREIDLYFDDIEKAGVTKDFYVEAKAKELATIKANISQIVNGNVDPRFRDEATNLINRYVSIYRKDRPNQEIIDLENEIIAFLTEKHITKNPTEILKECVRLLQEGKKETPEYQVMRKYLADALKIAEQTKIQYNLVQNQRAAIGSKTKSMLNQFYVQDPNNNYQKSTLDTDTGLIFLVHTLLNANDNNVTLNLFLNQTGLSERVLQALINTADMPSAEKDVQKVVDGAFDYLAVSDKICSTMDKYFDRNIIPYRSFQDGILQVKKYAERKLSAYSEHPLYQVYMNYLEQISEVSAYDGLSSQRLKEIVRNVNLDGLQLIIDTVTAQILELDKTTSQLEFEVSLLDTIEVPETSKAYVDRAYIYEQYARILDDLADKKQQVVDIINNSHSFKGMQG